MKTLFTGQNFILLDGVDSTNSYAADCLRQNKQQEGTVICSFNQTHGRGQRGNTWLSEPNKNVAFSVILHPVFLAPTRQFLLTQAISLAVSDLMTELLSEAQFFPRNVIQIKWPNDIYVNGKKIAGILIENTLFEGHIKSSIVGVGINCNQLLFAKDLNAVSLAMLMGKNVDLKTVVEKACTFIEARYLQLKAGSRMEGDYLSRLFQIYETKKYELADGSRVEGKITGVTSEGKLLLTLTDTVVREFELKQIRFL